MKISLIAAIGKNRELGKNNDLIWKIPEDLKRFREITRGHAIIMGRKTWDSLPTKPLPNRSNIVITRDTGFKADGAIACSSIEQALEKAGDGEIFVIGGGQIFKQAMPFADKLYLTVVDANSDADTFFPDYSAFTRVVFEKEAESEGQKYKFIDLER